MNDFIGDRECVTHHYACDCREEMFKQLQAENDTLLLEVTGLNKEIDRLKEFARTVINDEIDGCDIQELAERLGFIKSCIATKEDVDPEFDVYEVGDKIYKFTDVLAAQPQKESKE